MVLAFNQIALRPIQSQPLQLGFFICVIETAEPVHFTISTASVVMKY